MARLNRLLMLALPTFIALLTGCSSTVVIKEAPVKDPHAAWSRVLKKHVDAKGRVNFAALSKDRGDLEGYVYWVSKHSPESSPAEFPTPDDKLAYYLNAYNALSMYNVLNFEIPKDNGSFFKRFRFFYLTKFPIGGKEMSLYAFENDTIRKLGDPRVHVALNCMARSCPRLPQEPFEAKRLQKQLDSQATEFYNEPRNVELIADKKRVRVSEILDFFTDDFLKVSPNLVAYINKYRTAKVPEDYKVEFFDYDWTMNAQ